MALKQSSDNLSSNLKRLIKKKKKSEDGASSLSRSCSGFSNYDSYFFSSERKLDYSQFFFNDNEYLVEEVKLDEIAEESPDSIRKPGSSGSSGENSKRGSVDIKEGEDRLTNAFMNLMINKEKSIEEDKKWKKKE